MGFKCNKNKNGHTIITFYLVAGHLSLIIAVLALVICLYVQTCSSKWNHQALQDLVLKARSLRIEIITHRMQFFLKQSKPQMLQSPHHIYWKTL